MFKNPLLSYEKGGPSHPVKDQDNTTYYTCTAYTYTVNNLYDANEQVSTITIKGKVPACNVITCHSKIVLPGTPSRVAFIPKHYNPMDQLDKMPTLISILELLRISPSYKTILYQALQEASVPPDLNIDQFQVMVGSLKSSPCLTFVENDDEYFQHPHNAPLHIKGFLHKHIIKRILIDNGAGLNICTL